MINPARFLLLVLLVFLSFFSQAQEIVLKDGITLSSSVKIKKGDYKLTSVNDKPVLNIKGDNITIDFNNARLIGNTSKQTPDQFSGIAIQVVQGKNITIKNLAAKGYKVALIARNVENLNIENCNFSYNYRQHLNSNQEKEDLSDWMSYHHNEKDEWLRYGAAFYLRGCNNATISNCKVTGGQNALMLMECNDGMIYNNDFSFNSGIGIGLYRSSGNKFLYNKVLFN
ncbi:MAG: right-handed parallel beta-helix repeat-containing protein, partial [Flavisolibacter sp.]|nr:right-handed parallel beta-helix repeat-containing protein [Flavisolibacter sp.]